MESSDCRICLQVDVASNLIVPCKCKGSQKYAHKSCLKQWMNIKSTDTCPICSSVYTGISYRKKSKSFCEYLLATEGIFLGLVLGICVYGMVFYLVVIGFSQYLSSKNIVPEPFRIILIIWTSFYFFILVLVVPISIIKIYKGFKEWSKTHYTMEIMDTPRQSTGSQLSVQES